MGNDSHLRLLIATDGSPHANAALVTALDFPWPAATRASGIAARQALPQVRRSILWSALDRSTEAIASRARRTLARRWPDAEVVVLEAAAVDAVLSEAQRVRADVIVVGWRGYGPLGALLMGSVSRGVVRRAKSTVLIVKHRRKELRRLVIGFNGTANARRAVAFVARLRPPRGGQVTLFTAIDHLNMPMQGLAPRTVRRTVGAEVAKINAQRSAAANRRLTRAATMLTRAGWHVRTATSAGPPLRDLLRTVTSARADVLVVGACGTSGVRKLLLGSVAEGALHRSPVPVLVVR